MSKRQPVTSDARARARGQEPPRLQFRQKADGMWTPIVTICNIVMPLNDRPFMGFYKGERDAILTWIKQAMSEVLFDTPRYLVNEETGKSASNPDWELLPYFEEDPEREGQFIEIQPKPGITQLAAGDKLPISDKPVQ